MLRVDLIMSERQTVTFSGVFIHQTVGCPVPPQMEETSIPNQPCSGVFKQGSSNQLRKYWHTVQINLINHTYISARYKLSN